MEILDDPFVNAAARAASFERERTPSEDLAAEIFASQEGDAASLGPAETAPEVAPAREVAPAVPAAPKPAGRRKAPVLVAVVAVLAVAGAAGAYVWKVRGPGRTSRPPALQARVAIPPPAPASPVVVPPAGSQVAKPAPMPPATEAPAGATATPLPAAAAPQPSAGVAPPPPAAVAAPAPEPSPKASAPERKDAGRQATADRAAKAERKAGETRKADAERQAEVARRVEDRQPKAADPAPVNGARSKQATAPGPAAAGLDPAAIQSVLRANRAALEACVERALADPATASYAGRKVTLIILVSPDGRAEAAAEDPVLDGSAFGTCLRRAAAKMKFPQFSGEPVGARIPLGMGRG